MTAVIETALTIAGIVVPSTLLAAAVNRWLAPVSLRLQALLVGLVLVTLHLAVFTTAVPVPLDEVVRGYPYKGLLGEVESRNPVTNDVAKQMLPWMQVAREEIFSGRVPLWNRYSFSGYPLLGNAQSAPLSPFFLATLFVPLPKQLVAMAGLKLFVALLFGYLFLREKGAGPAAAMAGSMAFAFSVIQNVYLYYPLSSVTSLLPALAWSIVRSMRGGERRDLVALALVTAAAFSSGHPETVLHLAIAAVILMGIELLTGEGRRRASGLTIAYALLGVLLSAAVWLPSAEQILASQRTDALSAGIVEPSALPGMALWTAVHPDGFGNPARGNWQWISNYPMVAPTFVGLIPLMLLPGALVAASSDVRTKLFALASVVLLLCAMRWTIIGEWFNALPVSSSTANDRLRFVVVFFVATSLARRLEVIARSGPSLVDLASGFTILVLSVWVYVKMVFVTIESGHVLLIAMLALFLAACLAASLSLWRNWRLEGASGLPLFAAVVIGIELFVVNLPYNALTPRSFFAPKLPIVEAVRAAAPDEPWRLVGVDWVFLPNASAQYEVEDIRGSDPMAWAPYTRFFERLQAEAQPLDVLRVQKVNDPAIDFLNVRFLLGEPGFDAGPGWRRLYSGPDGELFENEEWIRRFFVPERLLPEEELVGPPLEDPRSAVVVSDVGIRGSTRNASIEGMWIQQMAPRRFRMTVDASERTFVASSQPAVRGWKVEVNEEPAEVHRVNGAFIGFWVPAGTSKVRVSYEPWSWNAGLVLSLAGTLFLLGLGGARFAAPRPDPDPRESAKTLRP